MDLADLKAAVAAANRAIDQAGLVTLSFGNASGVDRAAGVLVIKPSGMVYAGLTADDMVVVALEDGRVRAANLGDYKLLTIADVPPLRIIHLSDHHGVGPYGARSSGELVNPGVPAAVANAVQDACGARVHTLPITAERVWRALRRAEPAG